MCVHACNNFLVCMYLMLCVCIRAKTLCAYMCAIILCARVVCMCVNDLCACVCAKNLCVCVVCMYLMIYVSTATFCACTSCPQGVFLALFYL